MSATSARIFRTFSTNLLMGLTIAAFLLVVFWDRCVINIPAGHAGVMWWRFFGGTDVTAPAKPEGMRLIFPWDEIIVYDMRLQDHATVYDVISKEGLSMKVSASVRWRLVPEALGALHKSVGPDYREKLLIPEVGSILRAEIAREEAEVFYSRDRQKIQDKIYSSVVSRQNRSGTGVRNHANADISSMDMVGLVDVLLRQIELPEALKNSIEKKLQEGERVKEFMFRIETERLESQRKEVEANGIRKFQEAITPGMSDSYLRWQGINATLAIARSPNSKLVIMGNGPGGLPVILNGLDSKEIATPEGKLVTDAPRADGTQLPPVPLVDAQKPEAAPVLPAPVPAPVPAVRQPRPSPALPEPSLPTR